MRNLSSKGEQILTMYRICKRLETEYEKVMPVGSNFSMPKQTEGGKGKRAKVDMEETIIAYHDSGNWTKNYEVLSKFWEKVASVHISKLTLQKCINTLRNENQILKKALSSYLREVSKRK